MTEMISIIVPCFNEEESLPIFYKEIVKIMDQMKTCRFEIILVNDGSKDNTLDVMRMLAKKDSRISF